MEQNNTYAFGSYRLDTATQLLCTEESCVNLTPKVYRLLLYSLLHSVRLISREELFDAVWNQMLNLLDTDEIAMLQPAPKTLSFRQSLPQSGVAGGKPESRAMDGLCHVF